MLPTPARSQIWSRDDEEEFLACCPSAIALAFMLCLYTVQRPGDVLAMERSRVTFDGQRMWITLRQQKTDTLIKVPVHARLAAMLADRLDAGGNPLLVPSPMGKPWAYRNFARAWDAAEARMNRRRAKVALAALWRRTTPAQRKKQVREMLEEQHRQRRDLRRTGIVRLAEAGATTPQIAALSGHGIDYCQKIIETYLPRRSEVALGGMELWEATQASNVVRLPPGGECQGSCRSYFVINLLYSRPPAPASWG